MLTWFLSVSSAATVPAVILGQWSLLVSGFGTLFCGAVIVLMSGWHWLFAPVISSPIAPQHPYFFCSLRASGFSLPQWKFKVRTMTHSFCCWPCHHAWNAMTIFCRGFSDCFIGRYSRAHSDDGHGTSCFPKASTGPHQRSPLSISLQPPWPSPAGSAGTLLRFPGTHPQPAYVEGSPFRMAQKGQAGLRNW